MMLSSENIKEANGSRYVQVIVSMIACIPVFSYATAMGWISPYRSLLLSKESPTSPPLTENDISWMASVLYFPGPLTVFIYGAAADFFGRKMALIGCCIPFIIGWAMKIFWANATGLITARTLMGFSTGGAFVVCPLYVKEISDDSIRGTTGTFVAMSMTLGNLLIFIVGDLLPYHTVLWMMLSIPVIYFCVILWLPDTPSYLIKRGKIEKTAKVIGWLKSLPPDHKKVQEEIQKLLVDQRNAMPKLTIKRLFSDSTVVKAFWVALFVNLAREFCGCIAVIIYASHIFDAAKKSPSHFDLVLTTNQQCIMVASAQVIGSLLSSQVVDRAGRKPLLIGTSVVACLGLFTLGLWFLLASHSIYLPGWIPIISLCVTIFADASGLQPLPYIITTELFNFQLRSSMTTIIMSVSFFTDFALLKIFGPMINAIGYHYTFFIFSIIVFVYLIYVIVCVPETKKRSLEDIYAELGCKGNIKKCDDIVIKEISHI